MLIHKRLDESRLLLSEYAVYMIFQKSQCEFNNFVYGPRFVVGIRTNELTRMNGTKASGASAKIELNN